MTNEQLTHARLLEVLRYDPKTGLFYWRHRADRTPHWNGKWAGEKAGRLNSQGYIQIGIDNQRYPAHRLAFLYMTGRWPAHEIDHINGDGADNRWRNLREATHSQNMCNQRRLRSDNRSGSTGVYWHKATGKWVAHIIVDGKQKHLGLFTNRLAAIAKRKAAERKHYGEFAPNPVPEHMKFHPPLSE